MKTFTIHLPDTVSLDDREVGMYLAARFYENGKVSLGQAAELTGYPNETFMELLGNYGVSFLNYSADEVDDDVKNAESHLG